MIDIGVINLSTVYPSSLVAACLPALEKHLNDEVGPHWDVGGHYHFLGEAAPAIQPDLLIRLQDDAPPDGKDDLGYHLAAQNGKATALIFCRAIQQCGADLATIIGHEGDEAAVDPACVRMAGNYVVEIDDPVEETCRLIDGVAVPNSVLPSYFAGGSGPWDLNGQLHGPADALLPGGYIMAWDPAHRVWRGHFGFVAGGALTWRQLHPGRSAWRRRSAPAGAALAA
jgi:hypothetical protein